MTSLRPYFDEIMTTLPLIESVTDLASSKIWNFDSKFTSFILEENFKNSKKIQIFEVAENLNSVFESIYLKKSEEPFLIQ